MSDEREVQAASSEGGAEATAAGPGLGESAAAEFASLGLDAPAVAHGVREPAPVGGCARCGRVRELVAEKDSQLLCAECGWNGEP